MDKVSSEKSLLWEENVWVMYNWVLWITAVIGGVPRSTVRFTQWKITTTLFVVFIMGTLSVPVLFMWGREGLKMLWSHHHFFVFTIFFARGKSFFLSCLVHFLNTSVYLFYFLHTESVCFCLTYLLHFCFCVKAFITYSFSSIYFIVYMCKWNYYTHKTGTVVQTFQRHPLNNDRYGIPLPTPLCM